MASRKRRVNGEHHPKEIAPRLRSGERREHITIGVPPGYKTGIKLKAARHNISASWMFEQEIPTLFGIRQSAYIPRKKRG